MSKAGVAFKIGDHCKYNNNSLTLRKDLLIMAIQKDTEFIGTVDHLIFYDWLGIYCIRMLPKIVHQTEATKQAAGTFGVVSSRSKIIRDSLKAFITAPRDKTMQVGLKRALFKTLKNIDAPPLVPQEIPLMGFRFNEGLPLEDILKFPIEITEQSDEKFKITIPAITPNDMITAPVGTSRAQLQLMTLCFNFENKESFLGVPEIINIPLTDVLQPATSLEMEGSSVRPCIILVIAALSFWNENMQINPYGVKPLEIIGVYEQS